MGRWVVMMFHLLVVFWHLERAFCRDLASLVLPLYVPPWRYRQGRVFETDRSLPGLDRYAVTHRRPSAFLSKT